MKNHSATDIARNARKQTFKQNNVNLKILMEDVRPWKDNHDHEKVRRQKQDLFDNWEQGAKKNL